MSRAMHSEIHIESTAFIGYGIILSEDDYNKLPDELKEDWENELFAIDCGCEEDYFAGVCLSETDYFADLDLNSWFSADNMLVYKELIEELSKYINILQRPKIYSFVHSYKAF